MNKIRYVFYYPALKIGGAQLLFSRIAQALIKMGEVILIVEQSRTFIHNYLQEKDLNFEVFKVSETDKFHTEENDLLVLSLSYLFLFKQFIEPNKNSRIVFWDLHPFALVESTALSKIHKEFPESWLSIISKYIEKNFINKINTFISLANSHNALYFMCLRNYLTHKELFNLKIDPIYLPIPVVLNETIEKRDEKSEKVNKVTNPKLIKIGWISRMDSDKTAILKLLIEDIKLFNLKNKNTKIQLHAIGNGNAMDEILYEKNVMGDMLILPGVIYSTELDEYIKNIDLGFSMGTSALEFAIRGIATVLVPSTTLIKVFKHKKSRYLWLHDSVGYDVATEKFHQKQNIKNFDSIISEFLSDGYNLSSKSNEYVRRNHLFEVVFARFLELSNKSTLTYSKLNEIGIYNKSIPQHLLQATKGFIKEWL